MIQTISGASASNQYFDRRALLRTAHKDRGRCAGNRLNMQAFKQLGYL